MTLESSKWLFLPLGILLGIAEHVFADRASPLLRDAPAAAEVYFLAPAGVDLPETGHHHLLINTPAGLDFSQPLPAQPLPAREQILHFGKGQTETMLLTCHPVNIPCGW